MVPISLLSLYTIICFFLGYLIWKRSRQPAFLLGLFFLFYWTLIGPWLFTIDALTGFEGHKIGLKYYPYLEKLFPVKLNQTYIKATFFLALFLIIIELTVLWHLRKFKAKKERSINAFYIDHNWLVALSLGSMFLSLLLIKDQVLTAAKFNHSVYYITRVHHGSWYTLHQLLNQVSIVAIYIGFITYISGKEARLLNTRNWQKHLPYLYIVAIFLIEAYLLFIGNKRELFFSGIFCFLFYTQNIVGKINWRKLAFFITVVATPLILNDGLRGYSPGFLTNYFDTTHLEFTDPEPVKYEPITVQNTAARFLFSNELFVPHFSMYGVLAFNVPMAYGKSVVSLVSSFVPRFLWPDRPEGVYNHYVEGVSASGKTGYTIHHATAWYLNGGIIGICLGAVLIGFLWSTLFKVVTTRQVNNTLVNVLQRIAFFAFTAQLPSLIRTGPEGYKALILEAIVLPGLLIFMATWLPNLFKKKYS